MERWREQEVDILFFPSAFEAGPLLELWARQTDAYLVSSTHGENAQIVDLTGRTVARAVWQCPIVTVPLNLERKRYHWDTLHRLVPKIKRKYGPRIGVEFLGPEGRIVLTSLDPRLPLRRLEKEFKLERVQDYLGRARRLRDGIACCQAEPSSRQGTRFFG